MGTGERPSGGGRRRGNGTTMRRRTGARSKSREKKAKQREQRKRLDKARRAGGRSLKERMRRAGTWPLLECRINSGFREEGLAQVVIAREGPETIAAGAFLVDLHCLGVKDCLAADDLSREEYDRLRDGLTTGEAGGRLLEPCDGALAVKVVQTGAAYATGLGLRSHPDYDAARAIFGDVDPAACDEMIPCGHDGKPLYVAGPDDDIGEILRRLKERLGPDGFHYIVGTGGASRDPVTEDFPDEDDPDPAERQWGRMRRAEGLLIDRVTRFARAPLGRGHLSEAWAEYDPGGVSCGAPDLEHDDGGFLPWALFNRVAPRRRRSGRRRGAPRPIALDYLDEQGDALDPFERRFLEAVCRRPFSFHAVESVEPGRALGLCDVLTGAVHTVRERKASGLVQVGDIVYGRVLELDSVAILVGCGSIPLPASLRIDLVDLRESIAGEGGFLTEETLRAADGVLREFYWRIAESVLHPPAPVLQNTDGEALVLCRVSFDLHCTAGEALAELQDLAPDWEDEDFRRDAVFDARGELERIELPWIVPGNKVHESWDNTVLGHLTIAGCELVAEVNSKARAERIRREVERRLGARAAHRATEEEPAQKLMADARRRRERGELRAGRADVRSAVEHEPAEREALERLMAEHWAAWPDTKLPALGGKTPREAAGTASGRERLEALLADMASRKLKDELLRPDFEGLRQELGLPAEPRRAVSVGS